jgi:LuxR family maltose regulon positive regulatory protein
LIQALDKHVGDQLILVCAPAGFGKSTLIGTWIDFHEKKSRGSEPLLPTAWLSLDSNDSDLNQFLDYFIAAIQTIFSDACPNTLTLLRERQQIPRSVLFTTFCNELEKLPSELILVLDDYQSLHGTEVHDLIGELIQHWPNSLHLVLISRISPPLPLVPLRAKGLILEVRTRDLRFTPEESAAYLEPLIPNFTDQKALALLEERFEGWPAGLHLAALTLRPKDSQDSVLQALSDENMNITSYLVSEVINQQLPVIQDFLLNTSILDRFCIQLCESVMAGTDASLSVRECLDLIESSELFLIPLDNHREWYRYHQLFQELLQQRLSTRSTPERIATLHRMASTWFEEYDFLEEALLHAMAAGDTALVVRQMVSGLRDVINREDRITLERWLHLLPEEMIQLNPELLMIKAWALEFAWRIDLQAQALVQIEELLDSKERKQLPANELKILYGQILVLKAQQAYFSNQTTQAIDLCRQAIALLPPSWIFVRGGAMFYLGMSMQATGEAQAAERLLSDAYATYGDKNDAYAILLLESMCFNYLNSGMLDQVRQTAQVLLRQATLRGVVINKNWGDWFLGVVYFHRNELEAAAKHFTQIIENRYNAQITTYRDAVAGLAVINEIKGECSESQQLLDSISQFDLEQRGSEDTRTRSLRARLMYMQGDLEGAGRWSDTFTIPPQDQALLWLEEPQFSRAKILITRAMNDDLRVATQILDTLEEIARRTFNTRFMIEILALQALANQKGGNGEECGTFLIQALELARGGGFIRVFLDLGEPMRAALHKVEDHDRLGNFVHRILAAFPAEVNRSKNNQKGFDTQLQNTKIINQNLVEPLTPRELEVLELLRGPMSIKEIAQELNISYATVKRHTVNLYAKLGVNQRRKAVSRAEELLILSPR